MTEKKPGFFQRLFGTQPAPEPRPAAPETPPETPVTPEAIPDVPEPEPTPPPAPVEPEDLPPPGPPETTPEYIEDVEDQLVSAPQAVSEPEQPRQGWFARLASGLKRSSDSLTTSITSVFTKRKLDAATLDELEDVLIQADLGVDTAMAITETLRRDRFDKDVSGEDARAVLDAVRSTSGTRLAAASSRIAAGYAPWVGVMVPELVKRRRSTEVTSTGFAPFARLRSMSWDR